MIKMFNLTHDERSNENNKLILPTVLSETLKGNVILEWDWGIGRPHIRGGSALFGRQFDKIKI